MWTKTANIHLESMLFIIIIVKPRFSIFQKFLMTDRTTDRLTDKVLFTDNFHRLKNLRQKILAISLVKYVKEKSSIIFSA